jgi:hypothetical protein
MEEAVRSAVLRLGPLARLARAHVLCHVDVLPHPEGQAPNQQACLAPAEVSAKWAVMALAHHLRTQPATHWDAEPVRFALPPPVKQAAPHQKRPARRGPRAVQDSCTVAVDGLAECRPRPPHDWPEEGVDCQLPDQGLDEGRREEVIC